MKSLSECQWDAFFGRVDAGEEVYVCYHETPFQGAARRCPNCVSKLKEMSFEMPSPEKVIFPKHGPYGQNKSFISRNRKFYKHLFIDDPPMTMKEAAIFYGISYGRVQQLRNKFRRRAFFLLHRQELEKRRHKQFKKNFMGDDHD